MKKRFYFALTTCALAVAACSTTPDCLKSQPYMNAKSFPPLKSPPGLDVPAADPDMRIPEVANGPVGYYEEAPFDVDSDDPAARCLVTPPPIRSG